MTGERKPVVTFYLPEDATPLRKIAAAVSWRREADDFVQQYVAEARAAGGMREVLIDLALGTRFDMETWQEALATMNEEEVAVATRAMRQRLHPGRDEG